MIFRAPYRLTIITQRTFTKIYNISVATNIDDIPWETILAPIDFRSEDSLYGKPMSVDSNNVSRHYNPKFSVVRLLNTYNFVV